MKVRVGVGTGTQVSSGDELGGIVDDLEALGFDSLWLSDILTLPGDDPLAGMAFAAGRVGRLKVGTTMVLPGRNPIRLAKQLATIDRLSGGRLLLTFVIGLRLPSELEAMGVRAQDRASSVDDTLPLLRRLWSEDDVHHDDGAWSLHGVTVEPKPVQQPLDVWLGGNTPSALRRVGALADGWLPALCTPGQAAVDRRIVEEAAAAAGRAIDAEHFGVSIGYARGNIPTALAARMSARARGGQLTEIVPNGIGALRELLLRFIDVGFSKFVVRPLATPASWRRELEELASGVLDLQN